MATFEGVVYVRPAERGIVLLPTGSFETGDGIDLDEWIADALAASRWTGGGVYRRARITVEPLDDAASQDGAERHAGRGE